MKKPKIRITDVKPEETEEFFELLADALVVPQQHRERESQFLRSWDPADRRAIRLGSEIAGGLVMGRWTHFFGCREVSAVPIMAVGVAVEHRRHGLASILMAETLRDLYRREIPISTLFAANVPLYRKAGYEVAIERYAFKVNTSEIKVRDYTCGMVRHPNARSDTLEALHNRSMQDTNGNIRRPEVMWNARFDAPWAGTPSTFLVRKGSKSVGYAVMFQNSDTDPMRVTDYCALNREAALRILTAIADHSSRIRTATWAGGSNDLLAQLLPDNTYEINKSEPCMLRIVSVPRALEERGYPSSLKAEVHFSVSDDIIRENNGGFVLKVRNGKGSVVKGGEGRVRIDIRTLALLYTCMMTPLELSVAGSLVASDSDLETMGLVFAGPRPWVRDHF